MSKRKNLNQHLEEKQQKDSIKDEEDDEFLLKTKENVAKEEEENYEFLIPISNDNKLRTFVDRYFLKHYSIYSKESSLYQYAFLHTNKH